MTGKKLLDSTGPSPVRDFIINSNGHTLITKILIGMLIIIILIIKLNIK